MLEPTHFVTLTDAIYFKDKNGQAANGEIYAKLK